jgi:hypothetical protein
MRRIVLAAFALALVTWFSPPALAQPTKSARGTVTAVAGNTLTVKVGTQDMKFTVDKTTRVVGEGGSTAAKAAEAQGKTGPAFTDVIKVGQAVEVSYHETGGMMHAAEVRRVASAGSGGGTTSEQRDAGQAQRSTGTVDSVNATTLTISGSGGGGSKFTQSFTVDAKTVVVGSGVGTAAKPTGGKVSLTDHVGKGDSVTVSYRAVGNTLHAEEIRVTNKIK